VCCLVSRRDDDAMSRSSTYCVKEVSTLGRGGRSCWSAREAMATEAFQPNGSREKAKSSCSGVSNTNVWWSSCGRASDQ